MLPIQSIVTSERLAELTALLDKALAPFKGTALEKQYAEQRKLFLDPDVPDYEYVFSLEIIILGLICSPRLTLTPGSQDPRIPPADADHKRELITVINIRPFSRGNVHLNTTNPLDLPLIDPNFLGIKDFGMCRNSSCAYIMFSRSPQTEIALLADGIKFVTKLAQTSPLSSVVTSQVSPSPNATDAELAAYIQQGTFSVWHPCGSASMLPKEQNGVVDANLKIYGTSNIRVADASIIPFEIGAHTLATVYGNALKAAEIFKTVI